MSWDVLLLNFDGQRPSDLEELANGNEPIPLGPYEEVRSAISSNLDGIDWTDPDWGIYFDGKDLSIEFNIESGGIVDQVMLHVRGSGDAIGTMFKFATPNNWHLLDCSTSEFLDPTQPNESGWLGFQAYRDKIVREYRDTK